MQILQKYRAGCLKQWQGCLERKKSNLHQVQLFYRTEDICQSFLFSSTMQHSKMVFNLLKSSSIQPVLERYSIQTFYKMIEKERYYYKTRPSMAGKLIWGLMGNKNTFLLLTKFYFGSLKRNDLLPKSSNRDKDSLMVYLLNDVREEHVDVKNEAGKAIKDYGSEQDTQQVYRSYPAANHFYMTEEQIRAIVKSIYREVERKMKRDKITKGR